MDYKDLSPELLERVRKCKTPEEILDLAKAEGYELSEEELQAVSGGIDTDWVCWTVETCHGACSGHAPFVP